MEKLIYQAIQEIPEIKKNLARYAGKPAVFYGQLPHSREQGWDSSQLFPRMIYNVDWSSSGVRKTSGRMSIDIFCINENDIGPEQLSTALVDGLTGLFLMEHGDAYFLQWDKSDSFIIEGKEPSVPGLTVSFDILFYPGQEGEAPSPVWGVNRFLLERFPEITAIGHRPPTAGKRAGETGAAGFPGKTETAGTAGEAGFPGKTETAGETGAAESGKAKATASAPFIYVKQSGVKNISTNYARAWLNATVDIAVMAGSVEGNRLWTNKILNLLSIEQEVLMENGSPFLMMDIGESEGGDLEKSGQITIVGQYGIMRQEKPKPRLNNIQLERKLDR